MPFSAPPPRPSAGTLRLDGVRYRIEGTTILDGLTAELPVTRLGIVGRNGSGKSTLARLLAGLIAPSEGRIELGGIAPAEDRKGALSGIGILFQNPDHQIIFPTVLEEMAFGLIQQGHARAEAEALARDTLAAFDKAHWDGSSVATLSQGQKHLLCLMAVAAMGPKVLILDEPFAGLDIPTRMQLYRALDRYPGGLIHVSHDPDDLATYDRVLWLDQGRLREQGEAVGVLGRYAEAMRILGGEDDLSDLAG